MKPGAPPPPGTSSTGLRLPRTPWGQLSAAARVGAGVVKAGPGARGPRLALALSAPPPLALFPTPDATAGDMATTPATTVASTATRVLLPIILPLPSPEFPLAKPLSFRLRSAGAVEIRMKSVLLQCWNAQGRLGSLDPWTRTLHGLSPSGRPFGAVRQGEGRRSGAHAQKTADWATARPT